MENHLTLEQQDALREVMTIGAGNAATALSQMVKKKVGISVPDIKLTTLDEATKVFGSPEKIVNSVYLKLLGDITGVMLFSFENEVIGKILQVVSGKSITDPSELSEMEISVFKETATIITGAYLNAMSKFLKMRFMMSNPGFASDMAGAILNDVLAEMSKDANIAIIMETNLNIADLSVTTYFFFIPDEKSLEKLLKAIGL